MKVTFSGTSLVIASSTAAGLGQTEYALLLIAVLVLFRLLDSNDERRRRDR